MSQQLDLFALKRWQRARVTSSDLQWVAEVWVKCGPPKLGVGGPHGVGCQAKKREQQPPRLRYETNVRCPHTDNRPVFADAVNIELLPDFASDVEYLTCEQFRDSLSPLRRSA